ncbi:MAG: Gfo/Idh/MocA family oxidoreductase [Planctomycetota bacterium]
MFFDLHAPKITRNRRSFIGVSAAAIASIHGLRRATGFESANARPRVAVVGCGSRWGWQLANGGTYGVGANFAKYADTVAVCDVDTDRLTAAVKLIKQWNGFQPAASSDYRTIVDRDDIDAVLIFTPDHWHAKIAIEAMKSGKDVYCEKPLSLTIDEGKQICEAARQTNRVIQVGTQQRTNLAMRTAVALARSGRLGTLKRIECGIGGSPVSPSIPVAVAPKTLDWNQWVGPAPEMPYRYLAGAKNETNAWSRGHYEFRWWYETSGGKLTDWGAHHVDIATWALGKTETGPVSIEPINVTHPVAMLDGQPVAPDRYNTATQFEFNVRYDDGAHLSIQSNARNGILIEGSEGRIFVNRRSLSGQPVETLKRDPLPDTIVKQFLSGIPEGIDEDLSGSAGHVHHFFDCLQSRDRPNSDVFSHHRALTTCHLAAIAGRLGRTLRWKPETETIIDDPLAQSMLRREPRKGFEIET